MQRLVVPALLSGVLAGLSFVLSGCAEAPVRAPVVVRPAAAKPAEAAVLPSPPATAPTPAPKPAPDLASPAVPAPPAPPEPEPPVSSGPPPDLAFSMAADDAEPPEAVNDRLMDLAARLKKGSNLSMRLTLFAPPVASREYALGLAAKASETLRRHLRGLGVPTRKIIRVVIDPRRATVAADERIHVEVRLIGDK
jgi:hypothetical protein